MEQEKPKGRPQLRGEQPLAEPGQTQRGVDGAFLDENVKIIVYNNTVVLVQFANRSDENFFLD